MDLEAIPMSIFLNDDNDDDDDDDDDDEQTFQHQQQRSSQVLSFHIISFHQGGKVGITIS